MRPCEKRVTTENKSCLTRIRQERDCQRPSGHCGAKKTCHLSEPPTVCSLYNPRRCQGEIIFICIKNKHIFLVNYMYSHHILHYDTYIFITPPPLYRRACICGSIDQCQTSLEIGFQHCIQIQTGEYFFSFENIYFFNSEKKYRGNLTVLS